MSIYIYLYLYKNTSNFEVYNKAQTLNVFKSFAMLSLVMQRCPMNCFHVILMVYDVTQVLSKKKVYYCMHL